MGAGHDTLLAHFRTHRASLVSASLPVPQYRCCGKSICRRVSRGVSSLLQVLCCPFCPILPAPRVPGQAAVPEVGLLELAEPPRAPLSGQKCSWDVFNGKENKSDYVRA